MARRNGAAASTPESTSKPSEPAPTRRRTRARATKNHTYVLDTSVLLADPAAFLRFAEHDVVLPLVVISELGGTMRVELNHADQSVLPPGLRSSDTNDTRILSVALALASDGANVTL